MDNKTIFVKTSKGENEMHGKTSHLPDDLRRALLMVDGSSTFSEISKRAAPSMRASLGETFEELERTGFIQDKDKVGKIPKIAAPPKMSVPGKMSVPSKISVPGKAPSTNKKQPVDEDAGELDFLTGFPVTPPEKPVIVPDNTKSLMAQAEERSRQKIEAEKTKAEKIKAQKEAEAIRLKAEQDAARIREEAMRRAKEEAEATRLKAEQEARKMREAAKLNTGKDPGQLLEDAIRGQQQESEAKRSLSEQHAGKGREEQDPNQLLLEAAIREQQLAAEAARALAERGKKERDEVEAARLKIEQEAKLRLEAAAREKERAEAARLKAEHEAAQILLEMEIAKQKAEQEAKARLEAEAKARLEAEAKALARIKAEEEARVREAAELLARQEREAAAREAAARAAEGREAAARATKAIEDTPADGSEGFAFDQFQIEEPQNLAGKDRPPAQKGGSRDTFSIDSFHVDEPRPAESPRDKHDKVQKVREEQERIAAEARARDIAEAEAKAKEEADARTREIADAQAKVWAEAEQRALENAKANAERAARQAEYSTPEISHVEKPVRVARVRREPFAWGKLAGFVFKLGVFLLILLAAALFIIPYTLPMRDYMPKVQQLLSARLHQPVHLGSLSGRILPMPRLDLGEIYIGDAKQFQAVDAQINFDLMGLFTDAKPISSVDFHGVKVRGPWVRDVAGWLQQLASQDQYPVSRMTISQGTLDADIFQLTGVEGDLNFSPAGKFTQASLRADSGKFSMSLVAAPGNKFQTEITVRNGALPMLPNWSFDELVAKGELGNDELLVKNFDAKILGGIVQGDAVINWRSGWRAQGALSAKAIVMKQISKLLDGTIDGTAHFKMSSTDLAGFTDSALLDGSFKSSDGLLSGMDIVETARLHSKENLPGGRTHYDALSGNISYSKDTYHFSQVKIDAGVMDATATFDVTRQQLSGKMDVKLSLRDLAAPVSLQMGGAADSPTLLYAR